MAKKARQSADSNGTPKKTFNVKDLNSVRPKTDNQKLLFKIWEDSPESSLFLCGSAGTGKTFLAIYTALVDVLDSSSPYKKLMIIRSTEPVRDMGHLPGEVDEKIAEYERPYHGIFDQLFPWKKSYENMKERGIIEFAPTAFLRGTTFDNTIIIVDECQNLNFGELDTVLTRLGEHSKIIFCGDINQSDLTKRKNDSSGFSKFYEIIKRMKDYFAIVEFTPNDIVRSGMVKEYIIQKERLFNS